MFPGVVFILVKTWKCPECPSWGEGINRMWYHHAVEYYAAMKMDKLEPHVPVWVLSQS